MVLGCGKRGDPLPPLRPYPGAAQNLTIGQAGNRIQLEWRAPVRNTDGTTEKLELAEVEVRRRVIDIPKLIEEQTKTIEPEPEPSEEVEEVAESETEEPETEPSPVASESAPPEQERAEGSEAPVEDEEPRDEEAEEEEAPSVPVLEIPNFAPESRYVTTLASTTPGETRTFEEEIDPEWIGLRVDYAVVYINRSGRRGERSQVVQIDPVEPLPTPGRPIAEAGDGFVVVRWEGVEVDSSEEDDGEAYYAVFRRAESAEQYPGRPVNAEPITETELVDRSVRFGVESCYMVKSVTPPPVVPRESSEIGESGESGESPGEISADNPEESPSETPSESPAETGDEVDAQAVDEPEETPLVIIPEVPPLKNPVRIESEASPEVCLVPRDTFAPPAPSGLVAVRSGVEVLLTWTAIERDDVVGYRVYRSDSANGPFELLNDELVRVPTYSDGTAASGATYYYGVTALDDAPVANESTMSELSAVTMAPP